MIQPKRRSILEQPKLQLLNLPHQWRPTQVRLLPHQEAWKTFLLQEHHPLRGEALKHRHCHNALVPEVLQIARGMTDKKSSP